MKNAMPAAKLTTVTLKNTFHGSETTVRVPASEQGAIDAGAWFWKEALTARQIKRVRKALCGVQGCQCGIVRPA